MTPGGQEIMFVEWKHRGFLPRTVNFTLLSPNLPLPDTSQSYTPLSLRVTLENLRLLLYITTRSEYDAVEKNVALYNRQESIQRQNMIIEKLFKMSGNIESASEWAINDGDMYRQ